MGCMAISLFAVCIRFFCGTQSSCYHHCDRNITGDGGGENGVGFRPPPSFVVTVVIVVVVVVGLVVVVVVVVAVVVVVDVAAVA